MKKLVLVLLATLLPSVAFAIPSSVDRVTDHIQPLIQTDYIKGDHFVATSTTATSTFANGLDISKGCFAINGVCLSFGSFVTAVTGLYPILSSGGTAPVISIAFGTTTSNTWAGIQTFTNSPIFSTLGAGTVNSTGTGTLYNTGTSTPTITSPITYSGTLGQFIGGVSGSFGCATCLTANQTITLSGAVTGSGSTAITTTFGTAGANTVLANGTGATAVPTFIATSTLFQNASAATTGLLTSTDWSTFNGKQAAGNYITALTGDVTATGPGSVAATLATVNSNVGSFTNANITVNAKGLITAASNGTASGAAFPFTPLTDYGVNTSATTTALWAQAGLFASSSTAYPTLAVAQAGAGPAATFIGGSFGIGTTTPWGLLSVNPNALGSGVPEFVVGSSTIPHLIVTGAGNVGVGTTTPLSTLDLQGINGIELSALNVGNRAFIGGMLTDLFFESGSGTTNHRNTAALKAKQISATTGELQFFTDSSGLNQRMVIDTNGNVAIGTSTPDERLNVFGTAANTGITLTGDGASPVFTISSFTSAGTASNWVSQQARGTFANPLVSVANDNIGNYRFNAMDANAGTFRSVASFKAQVGTVTGSDDISGVLEFLTRPTGSGAALTERMRIADLGNIGIASTSPWGLLSVNPNALGSGVPEFVVGSTTSTHFVVTGAGKAGIGLTAPTSPLQVRTNVDAIPDTLRLDNQSSGTTAGSRLLMSNDNSFVDIVFTSSTYSSPTYGLNDPSTLLIANRANAPIKFRTNGITDISTRMTILGNGNIGISTTSPQSALTVNGDIGTDGLPPVVSLCGTSPAITIGSTDTAGEVTEGTLATGCTITFKTAKTRAPFCTSSSESGLAFSFSQSATALTITNIGALSSTKVDYICVQNNQ